MPEFTIRPFPKEGESIQGYLLRAAKENGRRNIPELLKVTGYRNNYKYQSQVGLERIITETSTWYCRWPLQKLKSHFAISLKNFWFFQDKRFIENVVISQPRFCVECFNSEDTQYFKFDWSLIHNSFCSKHYCALIDAALIVGSSRSGHLKFLMNVHHVLLNGVN